MLTLPGTKERICDAVARLGDESRNGVPVLCLVEAETRSDANMFGRLMVAGGIAWTTVRPGDGPNDRYELTAIVINLTGTGSSGRRMQSRASARKPPGRTGSNTRR